jgi:hypothetical protein
MASTAHRPALSFDEELSPRERIQLLRFAASFVWADCEVADAERRFMVDLARALGLRRPEARTARLLARPPALEEVDPAAVRPGMADVVRTVALEAIAADGRVEPAEMAMFELLDDLLPQGPQGAS